MAKGLRCWERGCPAKVLRCVIIATETLPLCESPVLFGVSVRSTERANYKALWPVRAQIHNSHILFFFLKDTANSFSATKRLKILRSLVNALKLVSKEPLSIQMHQILQSKGEWKPPQVICESVCAPQSRGLGTGPRARERAEQSRAVRSVAPRASRLRSSRARLALVPGRIHNSRTTARPSPGRRWPQTGSLQGPHPPWGLPHPAEGSEGSERVSRTRAPSLLPAWHGW